MQTNLTPKDIARFWSKVAIGSPDECWPWMAARQKKGYGKLCVRGRMLLAHRVAWELTNGPIPDGHCACHQCDNRPCCNPAHLWLGTYADNLADMDAKGRRRQAQGRAIPRAKLTDEIVRDIRIRAASGETQQAIADRYGIHNTTVWFVIHRRTWAHVE